MKNSRQVEVTIDPMCADFLDSLAYALPQYFAQVLQKGGCVGSQRRSIRISVILTGQDQMGSLARLFRRHLCRSQDYSERIGSLQNRARPGRIRFDSGGPMKRGMFAQIHEPDFPRYWLCRSNHMPMLCVRDFNHSSAFSVPEHIVAFEQSSDVSGHANELPGIFDGAFGTTLWC